MIIYTLCALVAAAIAREMYPKLQSYRNKFYQQAATLAKNKLSRVDPAEVERQKAEADERRTYFENLT